jgi:hypothetical protein
MSEQVISRDLWVRGRMLWVSRSCGDCSNGPPCRCYPGDIFETMNAADRAAIRVYLANPEACE